MSKTSTNRRAFFTRSAAVAGGVAIASPFQALLANGRDSRDWRRGEQQPRFHR